MTLFPYTDNIPFATNSPSADQPNMLVNTNSIDNLIGVDHVGFNTAKGGYHSDIHFNTQLADPAAVPTIGQLYTKTVTFNAVTNAGLFYENGAGVVTQIVGPANTNPILPPVGTNAVANGYTVLPGGIILQWGTSNMVAGATSNTPVVFPIPFPTNVFIVIAEPISNGLSATVGLTYATKQPAILTGFNFLCQNPNTVSQFDWFAIGN